MCKKVLLGFGVLHSLHAIPLGFCGWLQRLQETGNRSTGFSPRNSPSLNYSAITTWAPFHWHNALVGLVVSHGGFHETNPPSLGRNQRVQSICAWSPGCWGKSLVTAHSWLFSTTCVGEGMCSNISLATSCISPQSYIFFGRSHGHNR